MALVSGGGGGGGGGAKEKICILRSPEIAASPISLLSMGGVCGRNLTEGKFSSLKGIHASSIYFSIMTRVIPTES